MKTNVCSLTLVCAIASCAFAEDSGNDAAINEFFKAAKVKEKYELALTTGFDAAIEAGTKSAMPEDQKVKFISFQKKVKAVMLKEMGWEKVKAEYSKLYLAIYKLDELKQVTEMLKTPAGQILMQKELDLLPKAMKFGQDKAKQLMPKITQMAQEEMNEQ